MKSMHFCTWSDLKFCTLTTLLRMQEIYSLILIRINFPPLIALLLGKDPTWSVRLNTMYTWHSFEKFCCAKYLLLSSFYNECYTASCHQVVFLFIMPFLFFCITESVFHIGREFQILIYYINNSIYYTEILQLFACAKRCRHVNSWKFKAFCRL
jgi:hypothetical protein